MSRFVTSKRLPLVLLLAPAIAFLVLFYLVPLAGIVDLSFGKEGFSFANYERVVDDRPIVTILLNTFQLSAEVTLLCLILGFPVAYVMRVAGRTWQRVIAVLVILPLWTSILVRSYAWIAILGRNGLVNDVLLFLGLTIQPETLLYNRFSVYVGMVQVMLPFMILPLFSVLNRIDLRLLSASSCLGAGRVTAFFTVLMPLAAPGVAAGVLLVFMLCLGFFVTPAMLGGLSDITYVMLIEKQVNELLNWPLAAAMSVSLLLCSGILLYLYQRSLSVNRPGVIPGRIAMALIGVLPRTLGTLRSSVRLDRLLRLLPVAAAVATLSFIVVPILLIVPLAFSASPHMEFPPQEWSLRWFENYFTRPDWVGPTLNSLVVALCTTGLATLIGVLAAIAVVRFDFRGKALVQALIISPIVLPTMVLAVAFYFFFVRIHLAGSLTGLVIVHTVLAFPYVLLVVSAALRSVDVALERAALTLGSTAIGAFCRVTLPLVRPAILTGAFFAFLTSFDELVVALFVSGIGAATLPKRMWEGIIFEVDPTTAAAAVLLITLSVVLLGLVELLRWFSTTRKGLRQGLQVGHQTLQGESA